MKTCVVYEAGAENPGGRVPVACKRLAVQMKRATAIKASPNLSVLSPFLL